jgi:uncharacterized membrane protein
MYSQLKYLGLTLVMLLGLYPIVELTRVIIVSGEFYFPEMKGQFAAEIAIMWILYLAIVPVFLLINSYLFNHSPKNNKEAFRKSEAKNPYIPTSRIKEEYIRVDYIND